MKQKYLEELWKIQDEFKELNMQVDILPRDFYENYARVLEYHKRRYEKLLARAVAVEEYITSELKKIKQKIEEEQAKWKKVAVVCMTGDLAHPAHIAYIKTAREKIKQKFNLKDEDLFLIVWLEDENRTQKRKWKRPILNNEERKYQWKHIKWVDEVFIRNVDEDLFPSDLILYLNPDFWISHEEYFDRFGKYLRVSRKLKYWTFWKTKAIIIGYKDPDKYLQEGDIRKKWDLSTTNIVRRILEKQSDLITKKFPDKVVELLIKINFSNLNNNTNESNNTSKK